MAKKYNYNSDWMSRKMDEQLEQIEDRLSALYANASYEVNEQFAKYAKTFEKEDKQKFAEMQEGVISKEEYSLWRQRHILQTDLYKATVDKITGTLVNTDVMAMALVDGQLPMVVAQSYNFVQSLGWKEADESGLSVGTFQIYNADAVQAIIKENPDLLPVVDVPEDEKWNKEKINNTIATSIIKGDPIDKVAENLQKVTNMDHNSAVRNARTAMTGAENLGRTQSASDLKAKGIPMDEVWSATYDDRVRDSHLMLDGTKRDENGYFGADFLSTPLRFPADPLGDPEEVYNCRCRLNVVLAGIDHSQDDDLYEQFMKENYPDSWQNLQENEGYKEKERQREDALERKDRLLEAKEEKQAQEVKTEEEAQELKEQILADRAEEERQEALPSIEELEPAENLSSDTEGVVQGRNLVTTFERRADEYPNMIDDVIDQQGYNGLPRVVSEEEFNKAVEESGFIAQRTYGASSQEELDAYRDQLYNGEFYVNCSVGGCQYGQGMYCAGDYTGTLTEGIQAEMAHYQSLNDSRAKENALQEAYSTITKSDVELKSKVSDAQFDAYLAYLQTNPMMPSVYKLSAEDRELFNSLGKNQKKELQTVITEKAKELSADAKGYSYVETLTLTPDAKIFTLEGTQQDGIGELMKEYVLDTVSSADKPILEEYYSMIDNVRQETDYNKTGEMWAEIKQFKTDNPIIDELYDQCNYLAGKDLGVVATMMGYDAINAQGHGESGSYTVILNRTKVIFKEDK